MTTDPRDAQIAALIKQRDVAWAALREPGGEGGTALANALAQIQALEATEQRLTDQVNTLSATLAQAQADLADCLANCGES